MEPHNRGEMHPLRLLPLGDWRLQHRWRLLHPPHPNAAPFRAQHGNWTPDSSHSDLWSRPLYMHHQHNAFGGNQTSLVIVHLARAQARFEMGESRQVKCNRSAPSKIRALRWL